MSPALRTGVLILLTIALHSCDKIKDLVKTTVPATMEFDFQIDPISQTEATLNDSYTISFDINKLIKDASSQLSIDNIKSAKLTSVSLTAAQNAGFPNDNFTALSNLDISFSSNVKTQMETIASIAQTPANGYSLSIPVNSSLQLKDYLKGNSFNYKVVYKGNRTTTSAINCHAVVKYELEVGL